MLLGLQTFREVSLTLTYLTEDSLCYYGRSKHAETFDVLQYFTQSVFLWQKHNDLLQCACARGSLDVAEFALSLGANLQGSDASGDSPLALAARGGHTAVAEVLIDKGADIDAVNKVGKDFTILTTDGTVKCLKLILFFFFDPRKCL